MVCDYAVEIIYSHDQYHSRDTATLDPKPIYVGT